MDNESSSTRAGFKAEAPVTDHAAFGVNFEFEWRVYSTTSVNRFNRADPDVGYDTMRLRHYEGYRPPSLSVGWLPLDSSVKCNGFKRSAV